MSGLDILDDNQTNVYKNFTPPLDINDYRDYSYIRLARVVSFEDVKSQKLDAMPGFRVSWWYTGAKVTPENKYRDDEKTKQLVR